VPLEGVRVKVAKGLGVTTVDGISHELAHKYEAALARKQLSPKTRLHRYRKIRGILHFNIRRGNSIEACRKALDVLAMLQVKDAHPLDPTPIAPDDFWAIHGEQHGDDPDHHQQFDEREAGPSVDGGTWPVHGEHVFSSLVGASQLA
jgi:hypothetical protein